MLAIWFLKNVYRRSRMVLDMALDSRVLCMVSTWYCTKNAIYIIDGICNTVLHMLQCFVLDQGVACIVPRIKCCGTEVGCYAALNRVQQYHTVTTDVPLHVLCCGTAYITIRHYTVLHTPFSKVSMLHVEYTHADSMLFSHPCATYLDSSSH